MQQRKNAQRVIWYGIAINVVLAIAKALSGIYGHSEALIADAIESTSDVFASGMVLFGLAYAARPADENHPYGHGRAEPLFTFGVVGFLLVSASVLAYRSVYNIFNPNELPEAHTLWMLGITIVVKEVYFRITKKVAKDANSALVEGDAWHHRSDALTSATAFIGITVTLIFGKKFGAADDIAALVTCVVIIYNAYKLLRPALGEIMDEQVHTELIKDIRDVAKTIPGVLGTEKCYVRKSGFAHYVDLHINVDGECSVKKGHDIAHEVQDAIIKKLPQIAQVLIHVEPWEIGGS